MSNTIPRSATAIDCPACERMGRVTVIMPDGKLSTATCGNCQGHGFVEPCTDPSCRYCVALNAGAQVVAPMFAWTKADVYA